jgi:hypothetical protein
MPSPLPECTKSSTPQFPPNFLLSLLEADIFLHTPGLQSLYQHTHTPTLCGCRTLEMPCPLTFH